MYIAIEGNIGAGKSTVLTPLAEELGFTLIQEGIETDEGFQKTLAAFYADDSVENFVALQEYLANYRANIVKNLDPNKNYIMERSLQGAALFSIAENHTNTATWILQNFKHVPQPLHYIYLDCPAHVCLQRIAKRGRECEKTIPIEYLQNLEYAHREWAAMGEWAGKVTVVDSSGYINIEELANKLRNILTLKVGRFVC